MGLVGEERREFQRLRVDPATEATPGSASVRIVEIGVLGARVEHGEAVKEEYPELRFRRGDADVTLRCEMVRSGDKESAVRFLAAIAESVPAPVLSAAL